MSDRQIEGLPISARTSATTYGPILKEAQRRSIGGSWVRALERALKRAQRSTKMAPLPKWRKAHFLAWRKLTRIVNGA